MKNKKIQRLMDKRKNMILNKTIVLMKRIHPKTQPKRPPVRNLKITDYTVSTKYDVVPTISSDGSYKVGDRAPGISDFKVKLNHIGFNGITVTDYFGELH